MTPPSGGRNYYCDVWVVFLPLLFICISAKFESQVHEIQLVPTRAHEPHLKTSVLGTPQARGVTPSPSLVLTLPGLYLPTLDLRCQPWGPASPLSGSTADGLPWDDQSPRLSQDWTHS